MLDASIIFYLAMFTLGSVLVLGGWQLMKTKRKLKEENNTEEVFKR